MSTKELDTDNIPNHIAIIMDGNGRWAKEKGLPRIAGHKEGINSVRDITRICGEIGVNYLTLYTFSTENWNRPKKEVNALMSLLFSTIKKEVRELHKNNVKFSTIGDLSFLPKNTDPLMATDSPPHPSSNAPLLFIRAIKVDPIPPNTVNSPPTITPPSSCKVTA